jgi:hypothetical protein
MNRPLRVRFTWPTAYTPLYTVCSNPLLTRQSIASSPNPSALS